MMLRSVRIAALGEPSLPLVKTSVASALLSPNFFIPNFSANLSAPSFTEFLISSISSAGISESILQTSTTDLLHGNCGFALSIFDLKYSAVKVVSIFAVWKQLFAATGPSVKLMFTGFIPAKTHA